MLRFNLSTIYFNPTRYCNLLCRHCWLSPPVVRDREDYLDRVKDEITITEVISVIEEALELGLKGVKITGGEPFLRPDILDIIECFYKKGLSIVIETNGTLINEEIVKAIKGFDVSMVSVSIDSSSSKGHDEFRGAEGAFQRAVEAVELFVRYNIPTQIIFSLYRKNSSQLWETVSLAKRLRVHSFKINPINPMGRGISLRRKGEGLSVKELIDLNKEIEAKSLNAGNPAVLLDIPIAFHSIESIKQRSISGSTSRCAVLNIMGILGDGSISFCGVGNQEKTLIMGNIKTGSLKKIWQENDIFQQMRRDIPNNLEGVCKRCIMKHACLGGCRAEAYALKKEFTSSCQFCEEACQEGLFPESRLIG